MSKTIEFSSVAKPHRSSDVVDAVGSLNIAYIGLVRAYRPNSDAGGAAYNWFDNQTTTTRQGMAHTTGTLAPGAQSYDVTIGGQLMAQRIEDVCGIAESMEGAYAPLAERIVAAQNRRRTEPST